MSHAEKGLHAHTVFTDRAMYMEEGGRIDYLARGTLAALYANRLIVACDKRLIDGPRHGTMHRHNVEHIVACALPPDA